MSAVLHEDLYSIAAAWLVSVVQHRHRLGCYGKVVSTIIETPNGTELHLTEETTFKPAGGSCPMKRAQKWVDERRREREKAGSEGKINIESDQKDGRTTFARVVEVTVIRHARLDAMPLTG